MTDWSEAGGDPEQFWRLTPREVASFLKGRGRAATERYNDVVQTAWLTAAFSRAKRLPSLKKLLVNRKRRQTPEEIQQIMERWRAATKHLPPRMKR